MKKYVTNPLIWSMAWVIGLTALDLYQKQWAITHLSHGEALPILPPLPHLAQWRLTYNTGGPWSMLHQVPFALLLSGLLTTMGMLWFWAKTYKQKPKILWPFILIFSGAVGNLYNRISLGAVVDSIELLFIQYPIFNLADIYICTGLSLWLLSRLTPSSPTQPTSQQASS